MLLRVLKKDLLLSFYICFTLISLSLKYILQKNQYFLKMIDYVVKPYLNGKINYVNEKSSENTEADLKIRYFKLLFIWLHSKLTQKKADQLCKRFCKSVKVTLFFTSKKLCFFNKRSISKWTPFWGCLLVCLC